MITTKTFKPIKDNIFVTDIEESMQKTNGGIILTDDNFTDRGIRPRWSRVYAIGPDVDSVKLGEWVLVEHGRWTLRIRMTIDDQKVDVWRIEPTAILLVSEEYPLDRQRHYN